MTLRPESSPARAGRRPPLRPLSLAAAMNSEARPRPRLSFASDGSGGERPWARLGLRHERGPGRLQGDARVGAQWGRSHDSRHPTAGRVFVTPALLR